MNSKHLMIERNRGKEGQDKVLALSSSLFSPSSSSSLCLLFQEGDWMFQTWILGFMILIIGVLRLTPTYLHQIGMAGRPNVHGESVTAHRKSNGLRAGNAGLSGKKIHG
ncbi:hypothetical protein F0562_016966 [Nyssa sinensis]|uniref:Uncharacterized protein n=1 Tax=Nyssa sinensis TaxID=561372 RepID=A0A5J4ZGC2_9ASTE|nr:hypothetical protein F0562_016966 [Nyssa sinensis]